MGVKKHLRVQEIALRNKLPLRAAGGIRRRQSHLPGGDVRRGRPRLRQQARMSAAGIPQVTVVHGSSTAGGAYLPGLSDYVILVRGRAKVFLAGPPLLRAATGEIATDEELGGAEMHATVSGLGEYLAEDDADGIRIAREIMAKLPWNEQLPPLAAEILQGAALPAEETAGVVPVDYRKPYDVREVIARLVDDSDFLDFKALYGPHTVCGQAEIEGHAIGIIGNNGPIDADGAAKAAQFIQLCCQANTPIVFLQNTTGYMVGARGRAGRHHQARLEDDPGGGQRHGAAAHHAHRRIVRRRQLRHVRPRLRSALHLRLAEQPHRRDGRRAGGEGDGDRHRGEAQARRQAGRQGKLDGMEQAIVKRMDARVHGALRHRPAVGRRPDRSARHPQGAGASACRSAARPRFARSNPAPSASRACERQESDALQTTCHARA